MADDHDSAYWTGAWDDGREHDEQRAVNAERILAAAPELLPMALRACLFAEGELSVAVDLIEHAGTDPLAWIESARVKLRAVIRFAQAQTIRGSGYIVGNYEEGGSE
jgi:hypothetical protein